MQVKCISLTLEQRTNFTPKQNVIGIYNKKHKRRAASLGADAVIPRVDERPAASVQKIHQLHACMLIRFASAAGGSQYPLGYSLTRVCIQVLVAEKKIELQPAAV